MTVYSYLTFAFDGKDQRKTQTSCEQGFTVITHRLQFDWHYRNSKTGSPEPEGEGEGEADEHDDDDDDEDSSPPSAPVEPERPSLADRIQLPAVEQVSAASVVQQQQQPIVNNNNKASKCLWPFCDHWLHIHGSHSDGKSWKYGKAFSSQGKVGEFWKDWKSWGKSHKILEKSGNFRHLLIRSDI